MNDYFINQTGFVSYLYSHKNNERYIISERLYSFVYLEQGKCEVQMGDKKIIANPKQMIFIPTETTCTLTFHNDTMQECKGKTLKIRFFAGVNEYDYLPQAFTPNEKMLTIFKKIPVDNETDFIEINCKFLADVYTFLSMAIDQLIKNPVKQIIIIEKAIEYMQKNLACSVNDIIKICGISRCYLFKIFKEKLGTSPIKIKQKIQAEKAEKMLLNTQLSIENIANMIGFESVAHFRNVFYSRFRVSPGRYRKTHAKK